MKQILFLLIVGFSSILCANSKVSVYEEHLPREIYAYCQDHHLLFNEFQNGNKIEKQITDDVIATFRIYLVDEDPQYLELVIETFDLEAYKMWGSMKAAYQNHRLKNWGYSVSDGSVECFNAPFTSREEKDITSYFTEGGLDVFDPESELY